MHALILFLAIIGLLVILIVGWLGLTFRRALKDSYAAMDEDYAIREEADWIGQTGLDEATERELAHYLRREFGERLSRDPDALKANDLRYLGQFAEAEGAVHYWQVPTSDNEPCYAYVIEGEQGHMGWGGRVPPQQDVDAGVRG